MVWVAGGGGERGVGGGGSFSVALSKPILSSLFYTLNLN